jgi:hypothetical protein
MAIHFKTSTPNKLLRTYKEAVDHRRVETWAYDSDGDFTHTADQWNKKAWFRPKIKTGEELVFYILCPREVRITKTIYAIYHGRFIESFLRHCDDLFDLAYASAKAEESDVI